MVHAIYLHAAPRLPPYVLGVMTAVSYRVHSIFVLRLFNDPIAMLFLYAAILAVLRSRWTFGCVLFSLGVSIKMNVLLAAPGFGYMMLVAGGVRGTAVQLLIMAAIQLLLAAPFLLENAPGYFNRAFELGRQFKYVWSVNWKCIDEELFLDRRFQLGLLVCHIALLAAFVLGKWTGPDGGLLKVLTSTHPQSRGIAPINPRRIVTIVFTSNFIGFVFARSWHYQFYSWLDYEPFSPLCAIAHLIVRHPLHRTFPPLVL